MPSYRVKKFFSGLIRPLFLWLKKKYPATFERWIKEAGGLDLSAMLIEFNWLHRLFFRETLTRIQIEETDLTKIREAAKRGPIVYMMRNWGQIEYNYFNTLFLKEDLPLAAHANLIKMTWWMRRKTLFFKRVARLDYFYQNGEFPEVMNKDVIGEVLANGQTPFLFLNLPRILPQDESLEGDPIPELLQAAKNRGGAQALTIVPLTLVYDRRPGKAKKTVIDVLFGEKENPGSLRKTALFFRNAKKRAAAQVGNPIDLNEFLNENSSKGLKESALLFRQEIHQMFYKEEQAITGPRLKSRKRMIETVMQSPNFHESLRRLSEEAQKPLDQFYLESEKILEEIVADPNYTVVDLWSVVLSWVFKYIYDGLIVDEAGLNKVKQVARHSPLILVPSHRSHVDYLLLSYIFYLNHLSMPLIAAGANLSFWPLGYIFRRSGAFFLRRSFGSDKLYPLLFKSYLKTLLEEGYFQEFFIEGTRSRTGKLEKPRTGLLSMYLDTYFEGSVDDLYFIPISINYEKVLEEKSYAQEVKGASKKKERFWDLFRIGKYLHRSGQVYVSFAEPISLKGFLERKGLKSDDMGENKYEAVKTLAYEISVKIEEVSVATAPALVAAGLMASSSKGQDLSQLMERIEFIRRILSLRNVTLSEALKENYPKALNQTISRYKSQGLLTEHHDGLETFFTLSDTGRVPLNYYKNSILHNIVHLALLSMILKEAPRQTPKERLEELFNELSQIYSHEFIQILNFREACADLTALGALVESKGDSLEVSSEATIQAFATLMINFQEAYELTAMGLKRIHFSKLEEKKLIRQILELGHKLLLKGEITRPESLSQFTVQNALQSFKDRGLILTHEEELGKAGLKVYSSVEGTEGLDKVLRLLQGKSLPEEKTASLYLLKNE